MITVVGASSFRNASKAETILVLSIVFGACLALFAVRKRLGGHLAHEQPTRYLLVYVAAPLIGAVTVGLILMGTLLAPNG